MQYIQTINIFLYEWTNNGTNVVRWDYEANPSGWPGNFGMPERDAYLTLGNNVYLFYGEGRIFKYSKGIPKSALSVMNFDNWEEINDLKWQMLSTKTSVATICGDYVVYTAYGTVFRNGISTPEMFVFGAQLEEIGLQAKRINISRAKGMAGSLNIEFDNKDGILSPDGIYNPQLFFPKQKI